MGDTKDNLRIARNLEIQLGNGVWASYLRVEDEVACFFTREQRSSSVKVVWIDSCYTSLLLIELIFFTKQSLFDPLQCKKYYLFKLKLNNINTKFFIPFHTTKPFKYLPILSSFLKIMDQNQKTPTTLNTPTTSNTSNDEY